MGISYSAAFVLIDDPPNQQLFLPDEDKIIAKTLLHDCKHRAPSIPPRHMHSHYLASIYSPQSVFNQSLFVNGNRGAPKGRWRGNKWRIFSLLNGALEGLWLGVVGYKSQWFGCTHVLVHWLMGWQLCCLGVVLGHVSGHALRCSFGTGALSGPTGGRFRKKPSPTWRPAPLDQSEWYKTVNGGGNVKHLAVHCCLGDCVSQFVLCFLFYLRVVTGFSASKPDVKQIGLAS